MPLLARTGIAAEVQMLGGVVHEQPAVLASAVVCTWHVSSLHRYLSPPLPLLAAVPQTLTNSPDRRPPLWAACGLRQSSLGLAWAQYTLGPGWAAGWGPLRLTPASTCGWAWSRRQATSAGQHLARLPDGAVSRCTQCALCRLTACGALESGKHAELLLLAPADCAMASVPAASATNMPKPGALVYTV